LEKLRIPAGKTSHLLNLLGRGSEFKVLARLPGDSLPAAFVLSRFGLTWRHFHRFAFCTVTAARSEAVELRVSFLNVGLGWHGVNLFQRIDQEIEGEICDYVRRSIPETETVELTSH
jgi:hypothetical protein